MGVSEAEGHGPTMTTEGGFWCNGDDGEGDPDGGGGKVVEEVLADAFLVARKQGEGENEALEAMDHDLSIIEEVRPGVLDAVDEDLDAP